MTAILQVTVQDNGVSAALSVPSQNVQFKCGIAIGGTVNQPYATTSPVSLQTQFTGGPLVESGGLVCKTGNVCVAMSVPVVTKGAAAAVVAGFSNVGNAAMTVVVDSTYGAWDQFYVKVKCVVPGTIGTAPGPSIIVSGDAGRNWGNPISLGSATTVDLGAPLNTVAVGGTGLRLSFTSAQTMSVGDTWQFGTTPPLWNDAGLTAAFAAFQASQYGVAGVGSMHVVGPCASGDVGSIQTAVQAGVASFQFDRCIVELRDQGGTTGISGGTTWGGSTETEATWISALTTALAGTTAPRVCADGGYYNIPSPYANAAFGQPVYRRPLAWAHAAKRTTIPLQRRAGRVKDGPYGTGPEPAILVNPATDPTDGFVYHDERVTPGLAAGRVASAWTVPLKGQGFFQGGSAPSGNNGGEPLLSAAGSQFTELVIGNALDAACDIAAAFGIQEVSDDLLLQPNGTLNAADQQQLQQGLQQALNAGLVAVGAVSSVTGTIVTSNVQATGAIPITVAVQPRGYVNTVSETISIAYGGAQ
jgi:hypothetical protein